MIQDNNTVLKSKLDNEGLNIQLPACLKYERTEYAKKIRKAYEHGFIKERRCNMRRYTLRTDGLSNTITTVQKDNYIVIQKNTSKTILDI